MYRNETLLLEGDSIWGSITLLLSSLLSRPCTGLERAQFYEHMLLKSLEKQDKAILLLLKFFESKLREAIDASDEIMRFLLLLSTIFDNYADKSQIKTSPRCSGSEILSVWKQTVNKYLSVSTISKNHAVTSTEPFTDRTNIPSIIYQQYKHLDRNFLKNIECYEKIRRIIVDERGRIHPRACDPELRSLCKLRIGDVFYIVPWHEYLRCLVHVLMGEESILFRKNVDGFFSFSKKNKIFLELEDINLLQRLSLPFLKFANRLLSLEQFLCDFDFMDNSSTLCYKIPKNSGTKALLNLKLCASEQLWKFRDKVRHYVDDKKKCDSENMKKILRELLDMCNVFSHFVDIVLYIQTIDTRDMNTLLNIFYIMKITKGRMVSAVREFCDDVLVSLLRHYAECILFWLTKGEANSHDGVFSFSEKNIEMQRTVSGKNESIGLEESMLITKNFLDVWLFEGKFRKLVSYSPNLKQMVTEESNCVTVSKLIAELSEDKIRKALDSNMLGAVGSLLDFYFQKVYLSQHAIFIRCCIIDDFKQTARLLQDVYLCDDGHITEITMNVLINKGSDSELNSKSGNYQNFWLDEMMDYLLSKNYSSTLVHGFLQLTKNGLKLRYKPPFPLNIIFAPSILMNYERIWNLLLRIAVECTALERMMVEKAYNYIIALIHMRMWNFVRTMRYFFHEQIRCIVVNEYQKNLDQITTTEEAFQLQRRFVKKLYRHCLLGGKHVKLWNVLDECLALITKYRRSDLESFNILRLLKIFNDFQCNVDLFCNAVKRTSVGANYWLSDFLLLADFSGIYNDLRDGFSLNLNRTRNS
ncbi:Gamma-tubulin complex component [Dirofilaria immitis]